jgi:hypothetical protein
MVPSQLSTEISQTSRLYRFLGQLLRVAKVPGPPGPPGAPGTNAYTVTTADFVQPAVGVSITVEVGSSVWTVAGQPVYVGGGGGAYEVTGVVDATHVTIKNLGEPGNAAPGVTIFSGAGMSPEGLQGPAGANGVNAFTTTAANFVQPVVGFTVLVPLADSSWIAAGQIVFITTGGFYGVTGVGPGVATLMNLGYPGNAASGATIVAPEQVSPAGLAGPAGAPGTNGTNGTPNWMGAYNPLSAYVFGDAVESGGSSYVAGGPVAPGVAPPAAPWGLLAASGAATWPAPDNVFAVANAVDPTKLLYVDASGQAPGTATTIYLNGTVARPFRLPDISGTALVQQDVTGQIFAGLTSSFISNAGFQYSTLVANRAQWRGNQFGNNAGAPGITGFKSRGLTLGSMGGCIAGDILFRATAIGVTPNNVDVPLAGFISIQVPASFVPAGQNYLPTELEIELVETGINTHRPVFKITAAGETQTLRGVRAGGSGTLPTNLSTGALWSSGAASPEGVVTGAVGDLYSNQGGAAGSTLYVKQSVPTPTTGWVGIGGYQRSFVNADLVAGVLTVTHNLGTKYNVVQVYDDSDQLVQPDNIKMVSATQCTVDLTSFGALAGTWNVVVAR